MKKLLVLIAIVAFSAVALADDTTAPAAGGTMGNTPAAGGTMGTSGDAAKTTTPKMAKAKKAKKPKKAAKTDDSGAAPAQ